MAHFTRKKFGEVTRMDLDIGVAGYPVFVGDNPVAMFITSVMATANPKKVALIADETTAELFGIAYETAFVSQGVEVIPLTVPEGEACKSWEVAGQLLEALAQARLDRTDMVVALGGGAVSDLAGFVAHTYMRGVAYAIISTTLLGMVDACVGGKAAVDLPSGKNLAGAFHHPVAVMADMRTLAHLPADEFASGLAEAAKTAFLDGEEFTAWCEEHATALVERDKAALTDLVLRCMEYKAIVVASDPTDLGARECLNYGHTLGHAIERLAGYGVIAHGIAVAEGIRFAARVAVQVAGASPETVRRQDALLDALGIARLTQRWSPLETMDAMLGDKKVRDGKIRMVLMRAIGAWEVAEIADEVIFEHLRAWEASGAL